MVKGCLAVLMLLLAAPSVQAEDKAPDTTETKTEINVRNLRDAPILMRFAYVFHDHRFTLMEHEIPTGDDISYRFPVGLPGCERLKSWGLDIGTVTLLSKGDVVCEQSVSLCDRHLLWGDARADRCTWREMLVSFH